MNDTKIHIYYRKQLKISTFYQGGCPKKWSINVIGWVSLAIIGAVYSLTKAGDIAMIDSATPSYMILIMLFSGVITMGVYMFAYNLISISFSAWFERKLLIIVD